MKHVFSGVALCLPAMLSVAAGVTRAEAPVYEGFDYAPAGSDLSGKSAGTGFAGAWAPGGFNASNSVNYDMADGSLTFGALLVSGHRVRSAPVGAIAGLTRPLVEPLGTPGTTRYLSLLLRPEGTLHQGAFNGFFGLVLDQTGEPELFIGKPGGGQIGQYVVEDRGGSGQVATGTLATVGQTALLVLKAEFTAGIDRFTLYMNPAPGAPEPAAGTVKQDSNIGLAGALTIYSTGEFSLDELRVGSTFAEVTPVPEPASLATGAAAALLTVMRRRGGRLRAA